MPESFWVSFITGLDREMVQALKDAIELRWEYWRSGQKPTLSDQDLDSLLRIDALVRAYA